MRYLAIILAVVMATSAAAMSRRVRLPPIETLLIVDVSACPAGVLIGFFLEPSDPSLYLLDTGRLFPGDCVDVVKGTGKDYYTYCPETGMVSDHPASYGSGVCN